MTTDAAPPSTVPDALAHAIAAVPAGRWAVGVSGGADSVALLSLINRLRCDDVAPCVVHLDHQTRGSASTADASFVADLCRRLGVPCAVATLEQVLPRIRPPMPTNRSARYRATRQELFRQVVTDQRLAGVLLAHHADDQAETILHRLIRGSGAPGLTGMRRRTVLHTSKLAHSPDARLVILRPLLAVRRDELRAWLTSTNQPWRQDASNGSVAYARNRLRQHLARSPALARPLLELADACTQLKHWSDAITPTLGDVLAPSDVDGLPTFTRRRAANAWLIGHGMPEQETAPAVLDRLLAMLDDAATPARQMFPGRVVVRRRKQALVVEPLHAME